jgi:hypothetical protein
LSKTQQKGDGMITDIDYLKAVNSIGLFLKKRHKLSQPQVQKILYEINCTVEKELRRLN